MIYVFMVLNTEIYPLPPWMNQNPVHVNDAGGWYSSRKQIISTVVGTNCDYFSSILTRIYRVKIKGLSETFLHSFILIK